ncbi:hypothetical protein Xcel_0531 [Xylanimonas cellulosilytica DSM 15894]|uniref:DUF3168 domain-containing protein n=1 Tax=Xylanimonas cellulosilytica (strain DSM 15894 / JCM 12276 / CECT 5975 / KCTC 9989 / LMG 20990 / NBRC 107835 / XIL07) TaxID=446471 RepID=D1BW67_XYLCX|nr:hypothetical protein [Xylanimonas cellulosilytica]ACZ29570.1 hypothetical protein Xcel_0531 [Xylanimonas cellulosilytica DSM 15894]
MTAPDVLHTALMTRLRAITSLQVFEFQVPDKPPADGQGRVYPYAVVWPGAGTPGPESTVTGASGDMWAASVNVAAGDPAWVLPAVTLVRQALSLLTLAPGITLTEVPLGGVVTKDPDVAPARWFLPTSWAALTP